MAARVTQTVIEVLERTISKARVTQTVIEVLERTFSKARVTQTVIEVLERSTTTTTTTTTTTHFWDEDFSGMGTGSPPTGWTEDWNTADVGTTVEAMKKDKSLSLDLTSNAKVAVTMDAIVGKLEIQALALIQAKDQFSTLAGGVGVRVSGGPGTENGYVVFTDPANDEIDLWRYKNGATALLASASVTIVEDRWYWIRLTVYGSHIEVTIWGKHEVEPGALTINHSDSPPMSTVGSAGIVAFNADTNCEHFLAESIQANWPITQPNYDTTTTTTTTTSTTTTSTTTTLAPCVGAVEVFSKSVGYPNNSNTTHRGVCNVSDPGCEVSYIRVKFSCYWVSGGPLNISGASVGNRDTVGNFVVGQFTRLTFDGGNNGCVVPFSSAGKWSDWVPFQWFDPDIDLLVHVEDDGVAYNHSSDGPGRQGYYKTGTQGDTLTAVISGYSSSQYIKDMTKIEVMGGSLTTSTTSTTTTHTTTTTTTSTTSTTTTEGQANYSTDFSEYGDDAVPSDWTEIWEPPVAALIVKGDQGQYGVKALKLDHSTFGHYYAKWNDVVIAKDVDILAKFRFADGFPAAGSDYFKLVAREVGGDANKNGYELRLRPEDNNFAVYSWVNGTPSQIGATGTQTFSTYWYWARFRVVGDIIYARVWQGQPSDEPGTWDIQVTNSDHAGVYGTAGVGSYNGDYTYVDFYEVEVGGGSASAPADYLTTTTTTTTSTTTTGTTESLMDPATYISAAMAQSGGG